MPNTDTLKTISGKLENMSPAKHRPGCVLAVWGGGHTSLCYVPLPPHECRKIFPEKSHVTLMIKSNAKPDESGIIDTAGYNGRLWEIGKA